MTPLVIRGARWKGVLALLGAMAFVGLGAWLTRSGDPAAKVAGWVGVLFFGLCGVLGAGLLVRPAELRLHEDRFELTSSFRTHEVAWRDVDTFVLWTHRGVQLVGWRCRPGRQPQGLLAELNRGLGLDGALPSGWPMKPEALLHLLQSRLEAARDGEQRLNEVGSSRSDVRD